MINTDEITVETLRDGSLLLTCFADDGWLFKSRYFYFTRQEALRAFKVDLRGYNESLIWNIPPTEETGEEN
jgi:hypothetical protein